MEISTKFSIGAPVIYKNERYKIEKIIISEDNVDYELCPFASNTCDGSKTRIARAYQLKKCSGGILEPNEKEYLENVLRPYENEDIEVVKVGNLLNGYEYLYIEIGPQNRIGSKNMYLPHFLPNTVYKGMSIDYKYSKEELGLFKEVKDNE